MLDPLSIGVLAVNLGVTLWRTTRRVVLLQKSRSWPLLNATIEATHLALEHGYGAMVLYSYKLNGTFYSGEQTWYYSREKHAEAKLAQLPIGATLMIRYNPAEPCVSAIDEGLLNARQS